ncbi:alcohol dehydrogenase [Ephemerocybe angulata]|uniref:Alcohol dehydrogenase n=1 Tax=Ephemerocybe angulata TaxID=980116 RepID=A0A8H6M0K7_9AGAR|nr:alcohol dehydrogenase [Tulosesus angulatus]KAF6750196.1 alcohol dehydrogenase [Tulosesus angulatus]
MSHEASHEVPNGAVTFIAVPSGAVPEPGKTLAYTNVDTINLETIPLNGGILVKAVIASPDPGQRAMMTPETPESKESMYPPFSPGKPIRGFSILQVLRSELEGVHVGDHIHAYVPLQNYVVLPNLNNGAVIESFNKDAQIPWTAWVGVLGMPGQTAWIAWQEYSKAKKGEVAFVSSAAGPVGSLVVQLAKRDGLKVIASAGSPEKLAWLEELGADVVFNYKTENTLEVLKKEGPINVYWDNVGGETLSAALDAAAVGARFIECGMISAFTEGFVPVPNLWMIIPKCISLNGFIVTTHYPRYLTEFYKTVPALIASGELKYAETVYKGGFAEFDEAFIALLRGKTGNGKVVVVV